MRRDRTVGVSRPRHSTRMRATAATLASLTLALAGYTTTSSSTGPKPSGSNSPFVNTKLIAIFTHDGGDEHDWKGAFTDANQVVTQFDSAVPAENPVTIKALGGTMIAKGTSVGEWTMTFNPPVPANQIVAQSDLDDSVTLSTDDAGDILVHVVDAKTKQPANLSFTLNSTK